MAIKRIPRPRDPVQLGKLIVDIASGQVTDAVDEEKNDSAVKSGSVGGARRADKLTPERRAEIARKAAQSRWQQKV